MLRALGRTSNYCEIQSWRLRGTWGGATPEPPQHPLPPILTQLVTATMIFSCLTGLITNQIFCPGLEYCLDQRLVLFHASASGWLPSLQYPCNSSESNQHRVRH